MSKKPESKRIPLVRQYDEDTPILYANDSWVGHTKWEIQLSFGHILPFPPGGGEVPDKVTIRPKVTVVMTFEHAEAFLQALSTQLEKVKNLKSEGSTLKSIEEPDEE
jgi:hypothetical protein